MSVDSELHLNYHTCENKNICIFWVASITCIVHCVIVHWSCQLQGEQTKKVKTKLFVFDLEAQTLQNSCLHRQDEKKKQQASGETESKAVSQDRWSVCSLHAQTSYHLNNKAPSATRDRQRSKVKKEKPNAGAALNIRRLPRTQYDRWQVSLFATWIHWSCQSKPAAASSSPASTAAAPSESASQSNINSPLMYDKKWFKIFLL